MTPVMKKIQGLQTLHRATFPQKGMYELNAQDNLLALQQKIQVQIEAMTKAIQQIPQQLQGVI